MEDLHRERWPGHLGRSTVCTDWEWLVLRFAAGALPTYVAVPIVHFISLE
jgi:hypothetical protein